MDTTFGTDTNTGTGTAAPARLRRATPADAAEVARLWWASWHERYRGLASPELVAGRDRAHFAARAARMVAATTVAFEKLELEGDEATGANIVRVALEAPLKQIAINAGLEGGVVAEKVRNSELGWGLNAATGEYVDLIKAGIIDPAKVTRSALQNAASIAALFLTTEAVIADKPEKNAPAMPGGDGGMGGMDF